MCLCFDAMFGYVNLMLIKLLMMNLYAKVMYECIRWWIIVVEYDVVHDWWIIIWMYMLIKDVLYKDVLFEDVWFKDVLYKDVLFEDVWFKDVLCKDVLFEDVWFKDVLFDDMWFKMCYIKMWYLKIVAFESCRCIKSCCCIVKIKREKRKTQNNYTGSFHNPKVVLSPLHFQGEFSKSISDYKCWCTQ